MAKAWIPIGYLALKQTKNHSEETKGTGIKRVKIMVQYVELRLKVRNSALKVRLTELTNKIITYQITF